MSFSIRYSFAGDWEHILQFLEESSGKVGDWINISWMGISSNISFIHLRIHPIRDIYNYAVKHLYE